jgi:drug/metabolite transporter (DMT)-like permease
MITGRIFISPARMAIPVSLRRWVYLIVLTVIWGSSYILIKVGLHSYGYVESATIRLMTAGLAFLPLGLRCFRKIPFRKTPLILLSGLLAMFIPSYLFSLSQQHIQSSVAGILVAMTPAFTLVFSVFFFRKTYSIFQVAGLALGLLCCITLSIISSGSVTFSMNVYVFLIVVATMCYGLNINLVKQYLSDVPPLYLSALAVSLNGLLAFVLVFIPNYAQFEFTGNKLPSLAALLGLGIFGTALAQLLHNKLIAVSSPLFASTMTYLIPVVAVFWGVFDREPLIALHFIAIAGILVSVYMIRKEKKPSPV